MKTIAVIDDNIDQSSTVTANIELELLDLDSTMSVISRPPFEDPTEYFSFIQQNEVCVLILDEKLNDQANGESGPVDYTGSQLITLLRAKLPEFPIFALTVIPSDPELVEKYNQYEEIISRKDFLVNSGKYVPKFLRAAKNYLKDNEEELSVFNELNMLISSGNNDPELIKKFQAIQAKLELPISGFEDRNAWLSEYKSQLDSLESLNALIKSKLGEK